MIDLRNMNIILTGATGVIGNAILDKLILGGSNILASGTNEEKLKKIKAKYKNVNILRFDISDHKKIDGFIELDEEAIPTNCIFDGSDLIISDFGTGWEKNEKSGRIWRVSTDAVGHERVLGTID